VGGYRRFHYYLWLRPVLQLPPSLSKAFTIASSNAAVGETQGLILVYLQPWMTASCVEV